MPGACGSSSQGRIVERLSGPLVTTCRTDVDLVVTEYGSADLRGKTLSQRAQSLTAIARPEHRERLAAAAKKLFNG